MKKWKLILPIFSLISIIPLTVLVSCNNEHKPVESYTISGGSTTLNGKEMKDGSDTDKWVVKNTEDEPVDANLSIEGVDPSSDFPSWIRINDSKVTWTDAAVEGTYKFKVKAVIEGIEPIYSNEITLTIQTGYTLVGGSTTLNGDAMEAGSDSLAWVVKNPEGGSVDANLSIEGVDPSSDFPSWIQINDSKVIWTKDAVEGTYKFKVKAEIEGKEPIFSTEIVLTIAEYVPYIISGGSTILDGQIGKSGEDTKQWVAKNHEGQTITTDLSIEGVDPSSDFPNWIVIDGGQVKWSNLAVVGIYKFKVKAVIEGTPYYSDIITLTINDAEWSFDTKTGKATYVKYIGSSESVTIPPAIVHEGITYTTIAIGERAFLDNTTLKFISLPNTITTIGAATFKGCTNLKSLSIPNSVISIGEEICSGCTNLMTVKFPDGPNGFNAIPKGAFYKCIHLDNVVIPSYITTIQDEAFYECYDDQAEIGLSNVTFSDKLESIGSHAFSYCSKLNGNITLPSSISVIGEFAFYQCKSITQFKIETSTEHDGDHNISIGKMAFYDCENLSTIILPESVNSIGETAFGYCKSLNNFTIPDGVTSIADATFHECEALSQITIPPQIESIGKGAFSHCNKLNDIQIETSFLKSIPSMCFYCCSSLEEFIIPDGVETIGENAFSHDDFSDTSLKEVQLPASIKTIENDAFAKCTKLTNTSGKQNKPGLSYGGNWEDWMAIDLTNNWQGENPPLTQFIDKDGEIKDIYYIRINLFVDPDEGSIDGPDHYYFGANKKWKDIEGEIKDPKVADVDLYFEYWTLDGENKIKDNYVFNNHATTKIIAYIIYSV